MHRDKAGRSSVLVFRQWRALIVICETQNEGYKMRERFVHLVYATDKNYLMPTIVSAASAIVHSTLEHPLVIHLLEDGLSDEDYKYFVERLSPLSEKTEFRRITWQGQRKLDGLKLYHGGHTAYLRLFLPELLAFENWVISVDGDTLWLADPWLLWQQRDEKYEMLASRDPLFPGEREHIGVLWWRKKGMKMGTNSYLCTGVAIYNLKAIRENAFADKAYDLLCRYPDAPLADQDYLCYLTQGKNVALPANWGVMSADHRHVDLSMPAVIHYVGDVPWKRQKLTRLFSDVVMIWYDFVRIVLHDDFYKKNFSWFTRFWRRGLFVLMKHIQWLVRLNQSVYVRFRNTCGIPKAVRRTLQERFVNYVEGGMIRNSPKNIVL